MRLVLCFLLNAYIIWVVLFILGFHNSCCSWRCPSCWYGWLFDNLYNNEITAVVVHAIRAGLSPQAMAQKIAALAHQRAQDEDRHTPFSTSAQDAGFRCYGGKRDDTTVVVSYITSFEDA